MKQKNKINKRKIATTSMAILWVGLIVTGAFAALNDTLSHNESVTIEWVDIVDNSSTNLALEDVSDATNTPVSELTPGITYELTGVLENDSTVMTDWVATDVTNTPGINVSIADSDGYDNPTAIGEDIDVAQFGITVTVDQSVEPSTDLNFAIEFSSSDARMQPTAVNELFPDPALAACIANEPASGANGDVNYKMSETDLENIVYLNCIGNDITSLEGAQYLINLETLLLNGNMVSDLTPIANLTNLKTLNLLNNQVTDITALANLENLTTLELGGNQITDLSPIAGLTNLTTLYTSGNHLSDFSTLAAEPTTFYAINQTITLPDTTLGTPTPVVLDGVNGEDFIITWTTPGTYVNGELVWENPGQNSLTFRSPNSKITGTITQNVTP